MKANLENVGIWGRRRYEYLIKTRPSLIGVLRMTGELNSYLQGVNEEAEELLFQTVKVIAKQEGITEQLKADDQMARGAGLQRRPLPKAEAPTEATAETVQ